MKRKICIVTGTRADWGLLSPVAQELNRRSDVELQIIATNMHLSEKYGSTWHEIEKIVFEVCAYGRGQVENDGSRYLLHRMSANIR